MKQRPRADLLAGILAVLLACWGVAAAQEGGEGTVGGEPVTAPAADQAGQTDQADQSDQSLNLDRLRTLIPALRSAEEDLEAKLEAIKAAETEVETKELAQEADLLRERLAQLRNDFRTLATGIEEDRYLGEAEVSISLQENLQQILEPITSEMRKVTEGPREREELRNELEVSMQRRGLSAAAVERIDGLLQLAESDYVRNELETTRKIWEARLDQAESKIEVLEQQLEEREKSSPTTWEAVSGVFADFWRTRGLNLLLAVAAGILSFVVLRRLYRGFRRISPLHRKKRGDRLAARMADLAAAILTVLIAVLAVVGVFYLRGDWLLLAISILFILGLLWASKTALPPYLEQMRIILNLGAVRTGERLVHNGIPWRVERLNFYSEFRNPALAGGVLRLPVRDVVDLRSRPSDDHEPWFPTDANDWVILADDTYGKVVTQTPEQVVVLRLGGSRKTYPVGDFLGLAPENLSHGFRISAVFGIDYQHQAVVTDEVPAILQHEVEVKVIERFGREALRSLKVEFASAGASSLDFALLADFDGSVASRVNVIERLLQAACVDSCNAHGWVIPFSQVTLHRGEWGGDLEDGGS